MGAPELPESKSQEPRFELLERAGSGSFAEVWKARDTNTGTLVALKIARAEHARRWLAREAEHAWLALARALEGRSVEIEVHGDEVILRGQFPSLVAKVEAGLLASSVRGVTRVHNRIRTT